VSKNGSADKDSLLMQRTN